MKILFIGTNQSPTFQRWVQWFIDKKYEVAIVGKVKNYQQGVKFYDMSYTNNNSQKVSLLGFFIQLSKIKRAIKDFRPDLIHAHQSFLYGIFISILDFHPFALSLWGSDILVWPKKNKIINFFTIYALKKSDLILAESEHILEVVRQKGINYSKIKKIQFGIDIQKIYSINDIKLKYTFSSNNIIIFPRGLDPIYNPILLVKAIPLILKEIKDAVFIFKYSYTKNKIENINFIKKIIKEYKICKNNCVFIEEVDYLQLLKLFSISKIFISIPTSDSISISLIEGIIVGSVPIVSDIPANREIFGEDDHFIVPFDYEILALKVIKILLNFNEYKEKMEAIRQTLLDEFDQNKNMKKVGKYYEKLTKNN